MHMSSKFERSEAISYKMVFHQRELKDFWVLNELHNAMLGLSCLLLSAVWAEKCFLGEYFSGGMFVFAFLRSAHT